jgi:hypothetical protein
MAEVLAGLAIDDDLARGVISEIDDRDGIAPRRGGGLQLRLLRAGGASERRDGQAGGEDRRGSAHVSEYQNGF